MKRLSLLFLVPILSTTGCFPFLFDDDDGDRPLPIDNPVPQGQAPVARTASFSPWALRPATRCCSASGPAPR